MRSSTVLALAAVAAPALAAPLPLDARANGKWTHVLENVNNGLSAAASAAEMGTAIYGATKAKRDEELDARANGKWGHVLENVASGMDALNSATQIGTTIYGATKMHRRDEFVPELEMREDELLARANGKWGHVLENVASGMDALNSATQIGTTIYGATKAKRDEELAARANGKWTHILENVNNGLSAAASAADIGTTIYGATKAKRDEELDARANGKWGHVLENVASGMDALNSATQIGTTIYGATKMHKRDEFVPELEMREDELLARANGKWGHVLENVASGMDALNSATQIGTTIYGATKMHKRDELVPELEMREDELQARANGKWGHVLENVASGMDALNSATQIGTTIYGATKMHKRDGFVPELEMREDELLSRANGKWGHVLENVASGMDALSSATQIGTTIYGATKMHKRDQYIAARELAAELEARELLNELEARANGKWTHILENVNNGLSAAASAAEIGTNIYAATKAKRDEELEARANGKWTHILENVNNGLSAAASAADIGTSIYAATKAKREPVSLNDLL